MTTATSVNTQMTLPEIEKLLIMNEDRLRLTNLSPMLNENETKYAKLAIMIYRVENDSPLRAEIVDYYSAIKNTISEERRKQINELLITSFPFYHNLSSTLS